MRFPVSPVIPSRNAHQAGFSLIEVMVAMGILSGMVIALSTAWVSLSKSSLDLLLRQKAVFVLNGEMERLVALHQLTDFGDGGARSSSGYPALDGVSDNRFIYPMNVGPYMPQASDDFVKPSFTQFNDGADGLVLEVEGATETEKRTYVWLDRPRSLLAQISWTTDDVVPDACAFAACDCYDFGGAVTGAPCRALTLVLTYPFRFDLIEGVEAHTKTGTMTLRTIVGRRQ